MFIVQYCSSSPFWLFVRLCPFPGSILLKIVHRFTVRLSIHLSIRPFSYHSSIARPTLSYSSHLLNFCVVPKTFIFLSLHVQYVCVWSIMFKIKSPMSDNSPNFIHHNFVGSWFDWNQYIPPTHTHEIQYPHVGCGVEPIEIVWLASWLADSDSWRGGGRG